MKTMLQKAASILLLAAFICVAWPAEAQAAVQKVTAPKITSVGIETTKSMRVEWKAVSGATGYQVYRATSAKGKYAKVGTVSTNAYLDKRVKKNKTYWYKVRAMNGGAVSAYSKVASMTMSTAKPVLTAKPASDTSIKLSWKAVKDAKGYAVFSATGKAGPYIVKNIGKKLTFTKTKLPSGIKQFFKVRTVAKKSGIIYYGLPSAIKSATPQTSNADQKTISQTIALVNQYRKEAGLNPLKADPVLAKMAQKRAQEASVSFSHTRPDGTDNDTVADDFDFTKEFWLENLAQSYWEPLTPKSLVLWWKASTGHWKTIMDTSAEYVGVGVYEDAKGDWYYSLLTAKDK